MQRPTMAGPARKNEIVPERLGQRFEVELEGMGSFQVERHVKTSAFPFVVARRIRICGRTRPSCHTSPSRSEITVLMCKPVRKETRNKARSRRAFCPLKVARIRSCIIFGTWNVALFNWPSVPLTWMTAWRMLKPRGGGEPRFAGRGMKLPARMASYNLPALSVSC